MSTANHCFKYGKLRGQILSVNVSCTINRLHLHLPNAVLPIIVGDTNATTHSTLHRIVMLALLYHFSAFRCSNFVSADLLSSSSRTEEPTHYEMDATKANVFFAIGLGYSVFDVSPPSLVDCRDG